MANTLSGQVAVITGGSRGIGAAIGKAYAAEGALTVLCARSQDALARTSAGIAASGAPTPDIFAADLATAEGCQALFAHVQARHGRCDILVNCAGATQAGDFLKQSDEIWADGFALKFFAAVRLSRLFWPMLKAAEGRIVNIDGGMARTPNPANLIGSSVNAAMAAFGKGLAGLGIRDGVNVNTIHPGRTETDRNADLLRQQAAAEGRSIEEVAAETARKAGVRRLGQPEDIAALALFLVSPAASHIQGAAIGVDGGSTKGLY
ncbi:MAG: SDR family oxidoreductase [Pseudomonadota bacterium]|jgi:NAD(P)-dependent dehydrogenase (short-subunit alcohol dehydrogenase family)